MSERITIKDVEIKIENIEYYVGLYGSRKLLLRFDKGNQSTGITHKLFKKSTSSDNWVELFRAKTLKEFYNKLEGYEIGIQEFWYFKQR